jgi:hypothetical protein
MKHSSLCGRLEFGLVAPIKTGYALVAIKSVSLLRMAANQLT